MFITLFTSMLLTSDQELYNPILSDPDGDISYKAPLVGEMSPQFEKCPMTRERLIVIEVKGPGDFVAIRESISPIEISLEKSNKGSGSGH